jgi:hypothetical protein
MNYGFSVDFLGTIGHIKLELESVIKAASFEDLKGGGLISLGHF